MYRETIDVLLQLKETYINLKSTTDRYSEVTAYTKAIEEIDKLLKENK